MEQILNRWSVVGVVAPFPKTFVAKVHFDKIAHLLNRTELQQILEYLCWNIIMGQCGQCASAIARIGYATQATSYLIQMKGKTTIRNTFCYSQCKHGVWWNGTFNGVEYSDCNGFLLGIRVKIEFLQWFIIW